MSGILRSRPPDPRLSAPGPRQDRCWAAKVGEPPAGLDGANRANPPRKILVVVVLPSCIGEVDVVRHVCGRLRRRPVADVVGARAGSTKLPRPAAFRFRYSSASSSSDGRNQPRTPFTDRLAHRAAADEGSLHEREDRRRVLFAGANCVAASAGHRPPEASPRRARALIERRRLEIAPAVAGVVRVLVEDESTARADIADGEAATSAATRSSPPGRDSPTAIRDQGDRLGVGGTTDAKRPPSERLSRHRANRSTSRS